MKMYRKELRRFVEMAYLYAWGPQGDYNTRTEFHKIMNKLESITGTFNYCGNDKFRWLNTIK